MIKQTSEIKFALKGEEKTFEIIDTGETVELLVYEQDLEELIIFNKLKDIKTLMSLLFNYLTIKELEK